MIRQGTVGDLIAPILTATVLLELLLFLSNIKLLVKNPTNKGVKGINSYN